MKNELKICLPIYKIIYSLSFVLILSLIRGITTVEEIGIALETPMALLTIVFCADTYLVERQGRRWEVFTLFKLKNKVNSMIHRLLIQFLYLFGISIIGYGLFYIMQRPVVLGVNTQKMQFILFIIAIGVTILFWEILSMTISNLTRSVWVGIGGAFFIWLSLNCKLGDQLLGKWNLFSYTFRNIDILNDLSFMCGKGISLLLSIAMIGMIPLILKKRG